MKRLIGILSLLLVVQLRGQQSQQGLLVTTVAGITSSWSGECAAGVLDNRSQYIRQNIYHSVAAQGTGSWSVTLQYSNTACAGPWTNYGSSASISNSSAVPVATALDPPYTPAQFILVTVTGNAVATYTGQRSLYVGPQSASVTPPYGPVQVSSRTALTVPASTHGQGATPSAICLDQYTEVVTCDWALNGIVSAAYSSGITASGTGNCALTSFNGGGVNGAATIAIASGVPGAITITTPGKGYASAPTTATATSGTATCSGTATISSVSSGSVSFTWAPTFTGYIKIQQ